MKRSPWDRARPTCWRRSRKRDRSAAARSMGMSYRRAWLLVDVMNRCFQKPLVHSAAGGAQGGGAQLTEDGLAALAYFRNMEAAATEAAQAHLDQLSHLLKRGGAKKAGGG